MLPPRVLNAALESRYLAGAWKDEFRCGTRWGLRVDQAGGSAFTPHSRQHPLLKPASVLVRIASRGVLLPSEPRLILRRKDSPNVSAF